MAKQSLSSTTTPPRKDREVNEFCQVCINKCKQLGWVTLVNCPKSKEKSTSISPK